MADVRPIDANALIKTLLAYPIMSGGVLQDIREQPTLDYAPVRHGEWMDIGLGFMMMLTCSNCGKQAIIAQDPYPYCPNCGAKMEVNPND